MSPRRARADWVLVVMANVSPAEPRPHAHCTRCNERLVTILPLRMDTYAAVLKVFAKVHTTCKEQLRG